MMNRNCCIYWVRCRKYHENFVDRNDCSRKTLVLGISFFFVGLNVGKISLTFVLVSCRCLEEICFWFVFVVVVLFIVRYKYDVFLFCFVIYWFFICLFCFRRSYRRIHTDALRICFLFCFFVGVIVGYIQTHLGYVLCFVFFFVGVIVG